MSTNTDNGANLRVLYIAGYGRSGSTLLDRLLGQSPDVFSCGELTNVLRARSSADEYCACGAHASDCTIWREVFAQWRARVNRFSEAEYANLQRRHERMRTVRSWAGQNSRNNDSFARYGEYTRALFESIAAASGAATVVDSSKSPGRARALSAIPELDVTMVHLIRDVRGVINSLSKSLAKSPESGVQNDLRAKRPLRTLAAWLRANYACTVVCRSRSEGNVVLRYEDFTASHEAALAHVASLTDANSGSAIPQDPKRSHQIAGNRMRMKPITSIRVDERWRSELSGFVRRAAYIGALPLMCRHGYRL